ncbi:MAG: peptidylprolyl isomerase [Lachnospiraceae bacterium]|nr:peptidylprolyl isomerase [Lachnospiraceae bacterium]
MFGNKIKKLICFVVSVLLLCGLWGCSKADPVPEQMKQPPDKARHVRIDVSGYGSMEFVLAGDGAEQIITDFTERAKNGFYDGKPVYMVIKDYCIMAGDADAVSDSAAGNGQSADAGDNAENSAKNGNNRYYPFYGALCITDIAGNPSAEHFTVIGADTEFLNGLEELLAYRKITPAEYYATAYGVELDEETLKLFGQYGGAPWLYGHCRVFGQMVEGFDVLKAISAVPVSDDADFKPDEEILIKSVSVY